VHDPGVAPLFKLCGPVPWVLDAGDVLTPTWYEAVSLTDGLGARPGRVPLPAV